MNSPMVVETARALTHHDEFRTLTSDEQRVTSLYLAIVQRPPDARELQLCLDYVRNNPDGPSLDGPTPSAQSQAASRVAERQALRNERQMKNPRRQSVFQAEPGGAALTRRDPPDAWTKLAHALFQTNDAMFLR
jgi:hypothetical protein